MKEKKLVVFSGAGMSAESGLKTFRDHGGLWENYNVSEVATPEAWQRDPALVLKFYNMRRQQLLKANPNKAHHLLAELENEYEVTIITQNIDDLHERAGSKKVVHLHGELMKVRSEHDMNLVYECTKAELELGEKCEKGYQLRPHVVWFGEEVPMMEVAYGIVSTAEIFIVIGTSLNVYPAAGLIHYVSNEADCYLIDPNARDFNLGRNWKVIADTASAGLARIKGQLMS